MPEPEQVSRWYQALYPMAEKGGPLLTLFLALVMLVSLWWLNGWVNICVERNRALAEKILTQQQTFYQELRLQLAHCPPPH